MPSPRETGKQRATRIPLDYYKRPNRLERWKSILALLALLVTVVVAGAAWFIHDEGKPYISRGPVASVHAAWDNKCEACHSDFQPMSKNSATTSFFGAAGSHQFASNLGCEQCHEGTDHHKSQLESMTPGCGGCHRDHRGREASLVWLPDSDCTQCHENLKVSSKENKTDFENAITGFADKSQGHPDFRSLKSDPGRLKFNHRLHMLAGQAETGDSKPIKPWTLGQINEKDRGRYLDASWQKDKSLTAPVVLDCSSCHRLDSGDFGIDFDQKTSRLSAAAFPPRAAGRYMLPINYEAHCAACHPLTFDSNVKDNSGKLVDVPHHLQPDEVKDFLWGAYAQSYSKKGLDERVAESLKAGPKSSRPLPGKLTKEEQTARDVIGKEQLEAAKFLFKDDVQRADGYLNSGKSTCGECHVYDEAGGSKKILPLKVNEVWLAHAKFSHVAHRAADCRVCHANAYPDGPQPSTNAKDVLIAGIESCRQCHAPTAGVRSDCTECHLYHNGDKSLQGIGAAARDPGGKEDPKRFPKVEQFLQGERD